MWEKVKLWLTKQAGVVGVGTIMVLGIALIVVGIAAQFISPMLAGFSAAYTDASNATNSARFPTLLTVLAAGPTLIGLGFIVAVAIKQFLGIKKGFD